MDLNTSMTINVPPIGYGENGPLSNSSTMLTYPYNNTGAMSNQASMGNQTPLYYNNNSTPTTASFPNGTPTFYNPQLQQYHHHQQQQQQQKQHHHQHQQQQQQQKHNQQTQGQQQQYHQYMQQMNQPSGSQFPPSSQVYTPGFAQKSSLSNTASTNPNANSFNSSLETKEIEIEIKNNNKVVLDCKKHPWTDEE